MESIKKIVWKEAATSGLYLGLAMGAITAIEFTAESSKGLGWLLFAILVAACYFFTKKVSKHYHNGFTYPQSMGFIFKMMLFAGVIAGLSKFVMQNYVNPEYFQAALDLLEANLVETGMYTDEQATGMMSMMTSAYKNPILMVLAGVLNTVIYGGLIGLVVSAFVKKKPDPFFEEEAAVEEPKTEE